VNGAAAGRRLLVVSNGHGEDWISAAMIRALPRSWSVEAYPMVGAGGAYADICPIVGPRAQLPSEGWRNVKGSWRRDIAGGGLATVPPALSFLRKVRGRYDRVMVVGDMVGVIATYLTGYRDLYYVDVYKTGAARLYSGAEAFVIKRACERVFCRADSLAGLLRKKGVAATAPGNVMMDTIPYGEYDAAARRERVRAVTLLPGSRKLTAESFALQIEALRALPHRSLPDIFVAIAGGVDIETLARAARLDRTSTLSGDAADLGELTDGRLKVRMARGHALGNLIEASDLVMSQAGTATVQAIGLGRPALTFINPRDRRSRFADEQSLFGAARVVVESDVDAVTTALRKLLEDDAEREERSAIGRHRIGGPGALAQIVREIAA
jgi:uncharacterized protein (TIGR03492 family)